MPFDQSQITRVWPPKAVRSGVHIAWDSSAPAGTWYQVYAGGKLAARTKKRWTSLPAKPGSVRYDIGTVGDGEQFADFSGSLPAAPGRRATITWSGGPFLDPSGSGDVAGFRVYGSASPAGYGTGGYGQGGYGVGQSTIDAAPLAVIPTHSGARPTDGYGMGGYGAGGYGSAAGSYSWRSAPLWTGEWTFSVAAYDASGEASTTGMANLSIQAPPRAPGAGQAGPRVSYSLAGYGVGPYGGGGYGSQGYGDGPYGGGVGYGMSQAVLSWLPSPG